MTPKRSFADIEVNQELPPVVRPVLQEQMYQYGEVSGQYNPLHRDAGFAATTRFRQPIAPGPIVLSYLSEVLTQAHGADWIREGEIEVRFILPVRAGDTIKVGARVAEKRAEGRRNLVVYEVYGENQEGRRVLGGWAKVPVEG